jgi:hypothetical protein
MLANSEDYENLENAQVVISKAVPTGFLNQETQILPSEKSNLTANAKQKFSTGEGELETEVNKNKYSSKNYETNVVTTNLFDKPKPRGRKSVYAIAAVLSLLFIVAGASALFYYNEQGTSEGRKLQNAANVENIPIVTEVKTDNANLNVQNENSSTEIETAAETTEKPVVKNPNQEKSKPLVSTGKNKETQPDDAEFVIVDPEEGRVVFKGNTIETDRVIVNEKGVIYKKPPIPPRPPDAETIEIDPENQRRLTPRQIKRLNQIRLDMERRRKIMEARKKAEAASQPTPQ